MNKQQLAQKIWASANQMRSKIEANEYKDYILGFIFYKYLSDKEVKFLKENDYDDELLKTVSEEDDETVKWVQENIGYFIAYKDLFSTWLSMGKDFDVSNVRDALSAFSRLISNTHKKVFDKVFDTLQTGLSKLGDSSGSQTKAISGLLTLIKDIPMDGKQDYDVLGFIYEYLISNFAANAGKKAGEFYTPHEVSLLMSEIVASHLKGKSEIKIYDQFHTPLGEGIALEEGWILKQAKDFKRRCLFRVNHHGKAELVLQKARLLIVFRVAHARDRMPAAKLAGYHAAKQVCLIARGSGDEKVACPDPCLALHFNACAVAIHNGHVERFLGLQQDASVVIDYNDVVPFLRKALCERIAHFSVAYDYDFHKNSLFMCRVASKLPEHQLGNARIPAGDDTLYARVASAVFPLQHVA